MIDTNTNAEMITSTNRKRIFIFLAIAFAISWATALAIFLTGGLDNSPVFSIDGTEVSLAIILLPTAYMFGPAVANVLTRILTREGKENLLLKPDFDHGRWKMYLAGWFLPGILTIIGIIVYFLVFPGQYDSELTMLREQISQSGNNNLNPWLIVAAQTFQALLLTPLLNAIPTFGEEFGWRGYLLPKLMPLDGRKAVLLTGIIWGVWHWPIILMGHNYGMDYFGAPFLGPLAMVWFTVCLSIIYGWITIKAESVWPAVIAHGAGNGIAALGLLFVQGNPNLILGPTPAGWIGGVGLTITALIILLSPNALEPTRKNS